jgi:ATP-dependent protease ClpP protease subunit
MEILIDDEISSSPYFGITDSMIFEKLSALLPGEELIIKVNSPGGSVYSGITIFNYLREAAKTHSITVYITGLAASMASYIILAARTVNKENKIIVSENSIVIIHNPWQIVMGDYKEMQRTGDYLERLAAMTASTYAYVSGKAEKEVRELMDAETFLIGSEIIDFGFANSFEQINKPEENGFENGRNGLIINSKLRIEKSLEKMRSTFKDDLEKTAALIVNPIFRAEAPGMNIGFETTPGENAGGVSLKNQVTEKPEKTGSEGGKMTKEELKKDFPELYAEIFGEGKDAGEKAERERVEAHLKLGAESGSMKIAAQFINEGKTVMSNEVQAAYLSARMNKGLANQRIADNPPDLEGGSGGGGDDDAAMEAAWGKGISGKDLQGVK